MSKLTASELKAIESELRQYRIVDGYITRCQKGREATDQEKRRAALLQKFYLNNDYLIQLVLELRYLEDKKMSWKEMQFEVGHKYKALINLRNTMLRYLIDWFQEENCWDDITPKIAI